MPNLQDHEVESVEIQGLVSLLKIWMSNLNLTLGPWPKGELSPDAKMIATNYSRSLLQINKVANMTIKYKCVLCKCEHEYSVIKLLDQFILKGRPVPRFCLACNTAIKSYVNDIELCRMKPDKVEKMYQKEVNRRIKFNKKNGRGKGHVTRKLNAS